jgi:hypothetical protein
MKLNFTLAVYLCVNWWASWYPGSEPGGGLFGFWARAALYTLSAVVCGGLMFWNLNRTKWAGLAETPE